MQFLTVERETMERFLPGLDAALGAVPFDELEQPGNPALRLFRERRGPSLLVPQSLGGRGANALEAVRIHRALGARSPSLAIAVTMHNFSVATFLEFTLYGDEGKDIMRRLAQEQLLMASGFAEGRSGSNILTALMTATPAAGGFRVSGAKKPCCLSHSMDILTASITVNESGGPRRAIAAIPANAEGIERRPFWRNWVLAGAESDEVVLNEVFVPSGLVFFATSNTEIDPIEAGGLCWFQLLASATYLGVASALVERVLAARKGDASERASLVIEVEGAMGALEGIARAMMRETEPERPLINVLMVRFAVQAAIERAAARAAELLGGIAFVSSSEVSYYLAASRALAFHPPARTAAAPVLLAYLMEEPLGMV
jgi:alkylation response protein AidB-like acyl-CoA dehydrogenase